MPHCRDPSRRRKRPGRARPRRRGRARGAARRRHRARCASAWWSRGTSVSRLLDREQRAAHGLAWLATYVEAVRQLAAYAERMQDDGQSRRDRGAARPHRPRRISRADPRRHPDEPGRDRAPGRPRPVDGRRSAARMTPAVEALIATGNTAENRARARRADARRSHGATVGACGLDETLEAIRDEMRKFADSEVIAARAGLAPHQQLHPARDHRADGRARRVRPDHPRGVRRHGARQGVDVRRLRGTVARLYRRRLARHALGDRRRADPRRRHRGAEAQVAAEDRLRRDAADRGVHRAEHRLRPRLAEDARGARRRRLQGLRQQDLDHPSGARRPDDAAGAHQSEREGLPRPVDAAGREAARRPTPIRFRPTA